MNKVYYLVQAYKNKEDLKYQLHIYPTYLTSYDMVLGGANFGLQSSLHDALKFTEEETAQEWCNYAKSRFENRVWEIVPVDSRLFGRQKPSYVIDN